MKLLEQYKGQITGWVKHSMDDGSVNAALTFVAGQQSSELLVAASTASTVALLKSWQLPMAKDCTGMTSLDAYKLRGAAAFSGTVISFQVTSQWSNLAEYAVFARAPTSALRICIVATLAFCDRCATPRLTGAPTCGFWRLLAVHGRHRQLGELVLLGLRVRGVDDIVQVGRHGAEEERRSGRQ